MKVLLDQGIPYTAAQKLRDAGWDAVHVVDLGMQRASDSDIIAQAQAQGRCCVTLDSDFHHLVALAGKIEPSVLRIRREGLDGTALAHLLLAIEHHIADPVNKGALISLTVDRLRIRYLPIQ